MDILASIFAYMTCVAGIVGAFAIAISVLFSAPDPARAPREEPALPAKHTTTALNTATVNSSQTTAKATAAKATAAKRGTPSQTASNGAPIPPPIAEKRKPSRQVSAAQLRHLARQERDKHFAYQQDPDFESRFLGYAD